MGTRADFYVGVGKEAEWIGSIAMDGYPDGNPADYGVVAAVSEEGFRGRVADMLKGCNHGTKPDDGWPWPWDASSTTDFAYCWVDGRVQASRWGSELFDPANEPDGDTELDKRDDWPDMSARKNVAYGKRSGLIVVAVVPPAEPGFADTFRT